jgi:hypothetical protein
MDAAQRERIRLREVLERAHAELHDALNATPLDSAEGSASERACRDTSCGGWICELHSGHHGPHSASVNWMTDGQRAPA